MGLIPSGTLARLRALHTAALPDTAEVLDYGSEARGLEGGTQRTGETVAATYPCRVAMQSNAAERLEGGRPAAEQLYDVLLPHDAEVKPTQRLRVGTRVFRIVNVAGAESEASVLKAVCLEVS